MTDAPDSLETALDKLETRIEYARQWRHNAQDWDEPGCPDSDAQSICEWITEAIGEARAATLPAPVEALVEQMADALRTWRDVDNPIGFDDAVAKRDRALAAYEGERKDA